MKLFDNNIQKLNRSNIKKVTSTHLLEFLELEFSGETYYIMQNARATV